MLRSLKFGICVSLEKNGIGSFFTSMHEDSSCLYRYDFKVNALPHLGHTYGFAEECVWTWALKLDLSANALSQIEHLYGFSPGKKKHIYYQYESMKISIREKFNTRDGKKK